MLLFLIVVNTRGGVSTFGTQTANTVFGVCGAIIGLALGGRPSTRISRPSGPRRRKLW